MIRIRCNGIHYNVFGHNEIRYIEVRYSLVVITYLWYEMKIGITTHGAHSQGDEDHN